MPGLFPVRVYKQSGAILRDLLSAGQMPRSPISRSFFVTALKENLQFCDLDILLYKTHSFRIGAASWAAAKGIPDTQIRDSGRWKSNIFLRYIRTSTMGSPSAFQAQLCAICPCLQWYTSIDIVSLPKHGADLLCRGQLYLCYVCLNIDSEYRVLLKTESLDNAILAF